MLKPFDVMRYHAESAERLRYASAICCDWSSASAGQLWDAIQATGEKQRCVFGDLRALKLWDTNAISRADKWLPAACDEGIEQCAKFRERAEQLLGAESGKPQAKASQEDVEKLVGDRLRLDAAVVGLEWILGRVAASQRAWKRKGGELGHHVRVIEKVFLQYGECLGILNAVDELFVQRLELVSLAARGNRLNGARAIMQARGDMPWWLDGTLELIEFAKTQKRAWQVVQPLIKEGVGDRFRDLIFENIDRDGPLEDRFQRVETPSGEQKRIYEWTLWGPQNQPYRLQLITPPPSRRSRLLKMRVVNATAKGSRSLGRQPDRQEEVASPSWLAGRLMILEGVVFRWITSSDGRDVTAQTAATLDLGPGPLVLVDCAINSVLEPYQD
jgi:hypothetical protein